MGENRRIRISVFISFSNSKIYTNFSILLSNINRRLTDRATAWAIVFRSYIDFHRRLTDRATAWAIALSFLLRIYRQLTDRAYAWALISVIPLSL